jgi:hypothetical protein
VFYIFVSHEICPEVMVEVRAANNSLRTNYEISSLANLSERTTLGLLEGFSNDVDLSSFKVVQVRYFLDQAWVKAVMLECKINGFGVAKAPYALDAKHLRKLNDFSGALLEDVRSLSLNTECIFAGMGSQIQKVSLTSGELVASFSLADVTAIKLFCFQEELFVLGLHKSGLHSVTVLSASTGELKRRMFNKQIMGKPMLEDPLDFDVSDKTIFILDNSKKTSKATLKSYGLDGKAIKSRKLDASYGTVAKMRGKPCLILGIQPLAQIHILDEISGNVQQVIHLSKLALPETCIIDSFGLNQVVYSSKGFYVVNSSRHVFCFDFDARFLRVSLPIQCSGQFRISSSSLCADLVAAVPKEGKFELVKLIDS